VLKWENEMATAYFKRNSGQAMTGEITLVKGNVLPFKVVGLGSNGKHILVESSHSCVKIESGQGRNKGKVKPDDRSIEQPLTMTAEHECVATLFGYEMKPVSGGRLVKERSILLSPLSVRVVPCIELPPPESDAGMIARLLLAESQGPEHKGFTHLEISLESMRWMYWVLHNRLAFPHPGTFGIKQKNMRGVITAKGQFEGFVGYPEIAETQLEHINRIMKAANEGGDMRFNTYRSHVENAIEVATGRFPLDRDPCPTGLYGWKTVGSKHSGGRFVLYREYAGQYFYTLSEEFLSNHGVRKTP
jgi:hypothetical protein